jgi:hypothetical protein
MLKRRSFINALLVLCLLWGQQAALAHSISHIPPPADKQAHATALSLTAQSAGDEVSDFCLDCLAFSQVTTGASGSAAAVGVSIPAVAVAASPAYGRRCTPFFSFQARGPPAFL